MQEAAELFIPLLSIILTFSVPILFMVLRHAERENLIERGVDIIEYTRVIRQGADPRRGLFNTLRIGLLAVFLGIGVGLGMIIHSQIPYADEDGIMFASILISGGLGLILYYLFVAKMTKK